MTLEILMPTILFTVIAVGCILMLCIGVKLVETCVDYWEQTTGKSFNDTLRPWEKPE